MKVADIEGVGTAFAQKLGAAGVNTVEGLLEKGGSRKGRSEIAAASGLSEHRILEWVNRADLYRIKGVGSEYSDLLEAAGVDTVAELARRNAANLTVALAEAGQKRSSAVRRPPSESMVTGWIEQAKKLPRAIEY
jgi:predicted flap endonuclease-1-like 5' DNA nuclease